MITRRSFLVGIGAAAALHRVPRLRIGPSAGSGLLTPLPRLSEPIMVLEEMDEGGRLLTIGYPEFEPDPNDIPTWRELLLRFHNHEGAYDFVRRQSSTWTQDELDLLETEWSFRPAQLDERVDEGYYRAWVWEPHDSPAAKAHRYLERIGIARVLRSERSKRGEAGLHFEEGPAPGSNDTFVHLWGSERSVELFAASLRAIGSDAEVEELSGWV